MIYLDYNATTPLSENVKNSIINSLDKFGNPSSLYSKGKESREAIFKARKSLSNLINANPSQIIFTSCATESNNSVISSSIESNKHSVKHIITTKIEHPAIIEALDYYKKNENIHVTYLECDNFGRISTNQLEQSLTQDTVLVSIMMANNEIGNIYPIKEICDIVHNYNPSIKVHTDATQAIGKIDIDVKHLGVDYLTMSGHKFYAPKGVGALFIKNANTFEPMMRGGHQENDLRAGTENILSIIAMGIAADELNEINNNDEIGKLRDYIECKILKHISNSKLLGDIDNRVCNTSCILFEGINGIKICELLNSFPEEEKICISSGSACNSISFQPSHVMKAMEINQIPIRISIGRYTTKNDLDIFFKSLLKTINLLKKDKENYYETRKSNY